MRGRELTRYCIYRFLWPPVREYSYSHPTSLSVYIIAERFLAFQVRPYYLCRFKSAISSFATHILIDETRR